jgi:hypothetical protein
VGPVDGAEYARRGTVFVHDIVAGAAKRGTLKCRFDVSVVDVDTGAVRTTASTLNERDTVLGATSRDNNERPKMRDI